jgi:putative ABC transport system ATP-binding protein
MPHSMVLKDIHKTYLKGTSAETKALKGLNITVDKGEFVAIMGRSGSGKSSLMNIIGLLDRQFDGEYELNGQDVSKLSSNKQSEIRGQEIGFVFQQFNLLKRTSVLKNVLLPTIYKPGKDDKIRATKVIRKVGLSDRSDHKSNQLSGGQVQRVAIARALINNPTILLADEPTGNLDTNTAHSIMELFQEINRQGTTVIIITHEDDIAAYADRTVHLVDGKITTKQKKGKK